MKKLIEKHKQAWPLLYFIIYVPWYFGVQYIPKQPIDIYTAFDQWMPFIPEAIYFYIYWFVFMFGIILYLYLKNKKDFYYCCGYLFTGMTICLIIFTLCPTSFDHRPSSLDTDPLTTFIFQIIYGSDRCVNACPSIHVYVSIAGAVSIIKSQDLGKNRLAKGISFLSALLITLSTMWVKQHSIVDALCASLLALILYYFVYKKDIFKIEKWCH